MRERPKRNPLRPSRKRLGDPQRRPDVCRPGQQEKTRHAGIGAALPVDPALDRLEQRRRLLELVDEERQLAFLDEPRRIGIGRPLWSRIVEGDPLGADIVGDLLCQGALAALARPGDDDDGRVGDRRLQRRPDVAWIEVVTDAPMLPDIYAVSF